VLDTEERVKAQMPTDAEIRIRRALADPSPNPFYAAWAVLWGASSAPPLREETQTAWNLIAKKLGRRPPRAPDDAEDIVLKRRLRDAIRAPSKVKAKGRARQQWLDDQEVQAWLDQAALDNRLRFHTAMVQPGRSSRRSLRRSHSLG